MPHPSFWIISNAPVFDQYPSNGIWKKSTIEANTLIATGVPSPLTQTGQRLKKSDSEPDLHKHVIGAATGSGSSQSQPYLTQTGVTGRGIGC